MVTRSVHPHARGDNTICEGADGYAVGSPPRAWGQSGPEVALYHGQRFTPTRVGTISSCKRIDTGTPVHPHARGDN